MTHHFTAYIDEAGDEGFGKLCAGQVGGQSHWLALGACVVSRENDLKLPTYRNHVLSRFPKRSTRDLHFRDLKHDQRIVVCQEIARLPVGVCVAMSHKITISGSRYEETFKQKGFLYNYLVRWLLERLTAACARKASPERCTMKIVFSRRGGTDYQSMVDYFKLMMDGGEQIPPTRSINWSAIDFDQIHVENHAKWAGLQFADCVTSAFFCGLEPNIYGNFEPSYALLLKDRLIRQDGNALNCGLTIVPSVDKAALDPQQADFVARF
jgi:hypothetical protein